jgi:hypothetical protein
MSNSSDNETWIIEAGDAVLERRTSVGISGLSQVERLVYCLWVADYGMRNAGDLQTARDLYPAFKREALQLATLPTRSLQPQYFARFDRMCAEIRSLDTRDEQAINKSL